MFFFCYKVGSDTISIDVVVKETSEAGLHRFNPLTAGVAYIRVFILY